MNSRLGMRVSHPFRFIVAVVLVMAIGSGCAPLRKKFTREKKKKTEGAFVPVLVPQEYEFKAPSMNDEYAYYRSLWGVWVKEMTLALQSKAAAKRQKYIVEQLMAQLQGMQGVMYGEKAEGIAALMADMNTIVTELDEPDALRNNYKIGSILRKTDRTIRREFKPAQVQAYLKP